jgi:hypothetical protein
MTQDAFPDPNFEQYRALLVTDAAKRQTDVFAASAIHIRRACSDTRAIVG